MSNYTGPLRQAVGIERQPVYVHVPFTTVNLLNWKGSVVSYQKNIEGMYQLLQTVVLTHNPNWGDMQVSWLQLGWNNFFSVAVTVLCFGFRMRMVLITYQCFSFMLSCVYSKSRTFFLSQALPARRFAKE